ncbi:chitin synthase 1 [Diutina catenulata]
MSDPFGNFSDDDLFDDSAAPHAGAVPEGAQPNPAQPSDAAQPYNPQVQYQRSHPGSRRVSTHMGQMPTGGNTSVNYDSTNPFARPQSRGIHPSFSQYPQPYAQAPPPGVAFAPTYGMSHSGSQYGMMPDGTGGQMSMHSMGPKKGVSFKEGEPAYPQSIYSKGQFQSQLMEDINQYELERFDSFDTQGNPNPNMHPQEYMRPYSQHITFTGDDYMINPLQDADDDEDLDPFGDDDSLFSDTGEEIVRRGNTIRRAGTLNRKGTIRSRKDGTYYQDDEEDFTPRLNYTKTIKKARLINGNYVIDAPVPKALLDTFGKKITDGGREMSFMRYTGVTCGPSNFIKHNYSLRQELYAPPRETEIMVCITMYNEDEVLLGRTLLGVFENIKNLTARADPVWGEDSWKKIVVTIVNDGRVEFNKRAEALLTALGVFQEGYAKSKINNRQVKAHLYEYTTTVGIDAVNERVHLNNNSTPVQMVFCLKEKNTRKINSHRWAFQAFCPIINPRVVILLDCGTKPSKDAFYYLWRAFRDPSVAGACGELKAALGPGRKLLRNPLVAAQNFEYKISNILDKPMESVFGFISVLPGAFSAYRWDALLNVNGEGPLEKYFKGEYLHQDTQLNPRKLKKKDGQEPEGDALFEEEEAKRFEEEQHGVEWEEDEDDERAVKERNFQEAGIFTSNMYLAEDRILCFELVAKKNHNYVLKYVNEAKAETDVPEAIDDFVLQRRRWLNGSLFAAGYAVFHWTKIWKSKHSLMRKLWLQLEFYYQLVTITVSWFSISSFFLVFRILTVNLGGKEMHFAVGKYVAVVLFWFYIGSVVTTFVLAFGNTPRGTKRFYQGIAIIFAVLMAYMMFAAIYLAVRTVIGVLKDNDGHFVGEMLFTDYKFRDLLVSTVSTYVLYFVGAFLYGEPSFMVTSFVQYVLLSPTYINVLNIYAFSNIHDVSWGTRGQTQAKNLGSAKTTGDNNEMVTIVPGVSEELNEQYVNTLEELRTIPVPVEPMVDKKKRDDSYYALIRTITVLVWMLTNGMLIAIVLKTAGVDVFYNEQSSLNEDGSIGGNTTVFLTVILWIVAGLAAFRFIGCVLYLINKAFRPIKWRMIARREMKKAANSG